MLGQDFTFFCITYGKEISLAWFKNGKSVPNNHSDRQAGNEKVANFRKDALMIKRATKADEGNYKCIVTTSVQPGYSKGAAATLIVKGTLYACLSVD